MNKKIYSSELKKTTFTYLYSKKIAKSILDGMVYHDAFEKFVTNKELPIISDQRRREVFNVVFKRLSCLDDYLMDQFLNGSVASSKFVLLYAIANNDSLFLEFLLLYYRGALIGNKKYISLSDFDDFFALMKEKNSIVAEWGETTIKQLSGGYRNVLVESGIGYRDKKNIVINHLIVDPMLIKHIDEIGGKVFLQAVLGVE